jgi:hypothetical protein
MAMRPGGDFGAVYGSPPFDRAGLEGLNKKKSTIELRMAQVQVVNNVSSSRKYSPTSPCLKTVTPVGSRRLASAVDLAVTPNPYPYISFRDMNDRARLHIPKAYRSCSIPLHPDAPGNLRSTVPHVP